MSQLAIPFKNPVAVDRIKPGKLVNKAVNLDSGVK